MRDLFKADFEPYRYRCDRVQDCRRYTVEYGALETPEGDSPYTIVRIQDFVNVLAVVPGVDGEPARVALVLQYRYAPDCWQLEMPAGKVEQGETPLEAGARELREECGLVPDEVVDLGIVYPSAGSTDEVAYLVAIRCKPGLVSTEPDFGEQIQTVYATRAELEELMVNGGFDEAAGLATWLRADARGLLDAWLGA